MIKRDGRKTTKANILMAISLEKGESSAKHIRVIMLRLFGLFPVIHFLWPPWNGTNFSHNNVDTIWIIDGTVGCFDASTFVQFYCFANGNADRQIKSTEFPLNFHLESFVLAIFMPLSISLQKLIQSKVHKFNPFRFR